MEMRTVEMSIIRSIDDEEEDWIVLVKMIVQQRIADDGNQYREDIVMMEMSMTIRQ